jgi:hypothetical protein
LILSSVTRLRCPEGFKTYMNASYSSSMQFCKKKSSAFVHLRTIRITFTISGSKSSSNVSPTHFKAAQGNVVGLCCDCYRDRAKPASPIVANMMISKIRIVCEIYYKTNQIAGPHRRSYIRSSSLIGAMCTKMKFVSIDNLREKPAILYTFAPIFNRFCSDLRRIYTVTILQ